MNRFVAVAVLGLAAVGCAAGEDDPVDPPTPTVQRTGGNRQFSGALDPVVDDRQVITDESRLAPGALPNSVMPEPPTPGQ